MIPLRRGPQHGYSSGQSVEQWEPGATGREHEELVSDGHRVSVQMINILEMDSGGGYTTM